MNVLKEFVCIEGFGAVPRVRWINAYGQEFASFESLKQF
jgi:hypothetical protein